MGVVIERRTGTEHRDRPAAKSSVADLPDDSTRRRQDRCSFGRKDVGTFMAPLMTKVMVYVMVRVMIFAFGVEFIFDSGHVWGQLIVWMS